jgi:hypothetical protein
MFVHVSWTGNKQGLRVSKTGEPLPGLAIGFDFLPNTTDWYGRWRLKANASNDYLIDRAAQRERIFSGVSGIHLQDQTVTESMGPITDFAFENLAPSDLMIAQTRRRILKMALAHHKDGTVPPGVDDPELYLKARAGDFLAARGPGLAEVYREQMRRANDPTGQLVAAE